MDQSSSRRETAEDWKRQTVSAWIADENAFRGQFGLPPLDLHEAQPGQEIVIRMDRDIADDVLWAIKCGLNEFPYDPEHDTPEIVGHLSAVYNVIASQLSRA